MSDLAKPKKKKGGMGRLLMIVGGCLVVAGGGAAGGFYAAGQVAAKPTPRQAKPAAPDVHYFEVEKGFTSNLKEPDRYVEISLGLSTRGADPLGEKLKAHDIAIRSVVLGILAEQSAENISTLQGKTQLQDQLKLALNRLLKEKTGKASIDDVYFTNFIVQ